MTLCKLKRNDFLSIGYHEYYSESTRDVIDVFIRKGIGLFVIALFTSFLITGAINYLQVSYLMSYFMLVVLMETFEFNNTYTYYLYSDVSLDLVMRSWWWRNDCCASKHQRGYYTNHLDNLDPTPVESGSCTVH